MLPKMQPRQEPNILPKRDIDEDEGCESCDCEEKIKPKTIKNKGKSIMTQVQSLLLMVLTMSKEQAIDVLDRFEKHLVDFIEQIKRGDF